MKATCIWSISLGSWNRIFSCSYGQKTIFL